MRETTPSSFSSTIPMPTLPISCYPLSLWEEHHRTVSLRWEISAYIRRTYIRFRFYPHLHLPLFESPHGALIHAKRNATLGPAYHTQSRSRARADVEERRAVFPATKSTTAVLVTTQQKRARFSAIAHARLSALVVDINVVGCVVSLRLYLPPQLRREKNALGQGRKMEMGLGLRKSREWSHECQLIYEKMLFCGNCQCEERVLGVGVRRSALSEELVWRGVCSCSFWWFWTCAHVGHLICRWLVSAVGRCLNPHSVRNSDSLPLLVLEAASTLWAPRDDAFVSSVSVLD